MRTPSVQQLTKIIAVILAIHIGILFTLIFSLSYPNPFKAFNRTPPPDIPFTKGVAAQTPYWFFRKPDCPSIFVIAHGRSRDKSYMRPLIEAVWKGSNVCILAVDLPAHGERAYGTTTIGPREQSAIIDSLQWIQQQQYQHVILYGVSMGGSSIIHALQQSSTVHVQGFITDGTYSDLHTLVQQLAESIYLPAYIQTIGLHIVDWWVGYELKQVRPKDITPTLPFPYLALHGDEDQIAPIASAIELTEHNPLAMAYYYSGGHDLPDNRQLHTCVLSFIDAVQQQEESWKRHFSCSAQQR